MSIDSKKTLIYKKLTNELINIPIELSGYNYYQTEAWKFSVHNYCIYEKLFPRGEIINHHALFIKN